MSKPKFFIPTMAATSRKLATVSLLVIYVLFVGYAQAELPPEQAVTPETKLQNTVDNLANIQKSIEAKQQQIQTLREKLKKTDDASEKQELEQKIASIKSDMNSLQVSFEHLALGGINLS